VCTSAKPLAVLRRRFGYTVAVGIFRNNTGKTGKVQAKRRARIFAVQKFPHIRKQGNVQRGGGCSKQFRYGGFFINNSQP
jgi:hypothetical protein